MKTRTKQSGFSLTEVLMAVGILTVGLLMVAGTFPVGIHLTAVSTERTLGAIAADEAFAKVQLYGNSFPLNNIYPDECTDFNDVLPTNTIDTSEFLYPSDPDSEQNYTWSALFRRVSPTSAQVTVFTNRLLSKNLEYHGRNATYVPTGTSSVPVPVLLAGRNGNSGDKYISINNGDTDYLTDDSVIVVDETGEIFRAIEMDAPNNRLYIDREIRNDFTDIWVVPPPVGGGKSPCVGVYQRIINF